MAEGRDEELARWLADVLVEYGRPLVLFARQWSDSPEDLVQEALLELVTQRRRPERVGAWLFRVVRNAAISAQRSRRRRQAREQRSATQEAWFDDQGAALDAEAATQALSRLSAELRETVVARIWGELTFAEIAELTETSTSTAQRRYEQGLRELQQQLNGGTCTPTKRPN